LNANAEVDKETKFGWTALHMAANGVRDRVVELLLDANADVYKLTPNGETAIQVARRSGHDTIVYILERRMEDIRIVEASDLDGPALRTI
jgi:ankyrin repeat protein